MQANVARAAALGLVVRRLFAEMSKQRCSSARASAVKELAEDHDSVLARSALRSRCSAAAASVPLAEGVAAAVVLSSTPGDGLEVARGVICTANSRQAITPSAADFLVVPFKGRRDPVVNHVSNVWLVDSHPKRNRCNDHLQIIPHKISVDFGALFHALSGMVCATLFCDVDVSPSDPDGTCQQ